MKKYSEMERLEILITLSDKLWEEYRTTNLLEEDYLQKSQKVNREINNGFINTLTDLDIFVKSLGYMIIKQPKNILSRMSDNIIINKN